MDAVIVSAFAGEQAIGVGEPAGEHAEQSDRDARVGVEERVEVVAADRETLDVGCRGTWATCTRSSTRSESSPMHSPAGQSNVCVPSSTVARPDVRMRRPLPGWFGWIRTCPAGASKWLAQAASRSSASAGSPANIGIPWSWAIGSRSAMPEQLSECARPCRRCRRVHRNARCRDPVTTAGREQRSHDVRPRGSNGRSRPLLAAPPPTSGRGRARCAACATPTAARPATTAATGIGHT